jgi:glutathione S-transferase
MSTDIIEFDTAKLAEMKIHDWPTGPYPARVRIAVAEKNLRSRVQFVSVDLWKGEHKTPRFLAKNYSGTLPVLELNDGTFIGECTAITEYLDALDGAPTLTGRTPRDNGVIHMISTTPRRGLDPMSRFIRTPSGACASATRP